jgi:tetratricopeptide (TPR) repeat protein
VRRFLTIIFFVTLTLVCSDKSCLADSSVKAVRSGNQLYKQKKFDQALKKYNEALLEYPTSDVINFNAGAALYKKEDYQKAIESFTKALTTDNPELEARANYNIGNSKYRLGKLKENTDLAGAISLFRESLDYYKRAIELDEKDKDAKYNHELVERQLKAFLDKLKQQSSSANASKEEQKKGGGEEWEKEEQIEEKAVQRRGESEEKKQAAEAEETKKQEVEKEGAQEQEAIGAQPQEESKEMSREEAEILLEGYRQEEESKVGIKRERQGYYPEVLKDW